MLEAHFRIEVIRIMEDNLKDACLDLWRLVEQVHPIIYTVFGSLSRCNNILFKINQRLKAFLGVSKLKCGSFNFFDL